MTLARNIFPKTPRAQLEKIPICSYMSCGSSGNEAKDAANQAKHGIGFREAAEVFRGFVLTDEDRRRDYGERRMIALGLYDGSVIRVVFTERDGATRIISAWKANSDDRKAYHEAQSHRQV